MTTGYQWAKRTKHEELRRELSGITDLMRGAKHNKYNARKVELDGYVFDSQREAQVYGELKLREKAGEVVDIEVHPQFDLSVNGVKIATYTADFSYREVVRRTAYEAVTLGHIVDVKSPPTAKRRDFQLIRRLMRAIHNIDIEVTA